MDIQTAKDNIGKEVVLNEDTKPYGCIAFDFDSGDTRCLSDASRISLMDVDNDGDAIVHIFSSSGEYIDWFYIRIRHLSLATPTLQEMDELEKPAINISNTISINNSASNIESVELRLSIFNGDPSRTLEEMKEIEAWLLNK